MTQPVSDGARERSWIDRRKYPRFACVPEASVGLQRGVRAKLLNLGPGGALVESPLRLLPGSVTAIRFDARAIAVSKARICRAFVSGFSRGTYTKGEVAPLYSAGLEFEGLSAGEMSALSTFISGAATGPDVAAGAAAQPVTGSAPVAAPPLVGRQVSIRFPPGWALTWRKTAVVARAPGERGYMLLGSPQAPPNGDLCEFARVSMENAGFSVLHVEPAEVNGLPACIGFYSGWLEDLGAVLVEAAYILLNNQAYLIAGVAPWGAYERVRHEFFATINSFGRLSGEGSSTVEPAPSDATEKFDFSAAFTLRMKID